MITGKPIFSASARPAAEITLLGEVAGRGLVAHLPDLFARGADEGDVRGAHDVGELGVLGQEAVAGVNRVRPRDLGGGDDAGDVQIAVARRRAADAHVVVGEPGVQAVAVRLGIDGHGLDAQLLARADHPQGDFPAVRDQHLLEHQGRMSPREPVAVVLPPKARLSPESTPETFKANSLGFVL
jgi:hypothetical protein